MKIFVVGSLNMDLVVRAPFMPENGMTITGEGFMTNPGGKGANQAVALSKLGANAYMVGCVGDAFGNELKNTLNNYGVNTDFVEKVNGVSSGIAVIVVVDGDNRIILDAGSNAKITTELVDKALSVAEKGDYLVTQLEVSQEIVSYSLKKAKEKGLITVLNPAPAAKLKDGILEYCDYFIPNQSETRFYTDVYPENEATARKCAEILAGKGVKNLLITMGEKGSAGIIDGKFVTASCYKTNAIDTTAAGDTYVGGFVARLSAGDKPEDAMDFASRASSITCSRRGAQQSIPVKAEVDAKKA